MEQKSSTIGPIIGTLIVFIVLIAAALYIWGQHLNTVGKRLSEGNQTSTTTEKILIRITSTSTDPTDIEHDLNGNTTVTNPTL
jgi:hypothetical protein